MDSGDTAWMLMSTALVMIMLPGLALFYGGLVRSKNVLSTVMHSFFGLALVSIVWVIVGFTLAFGPDVNGMGLIGNLDFAFFNGVGQAPSAVYAATIPFMLFAMFQLMFAAITPALITGAFAERKRFGAFVLFTLLWSILVYSPIAHWVWSADGWLYKLGALDFAGGTVVHISSGVSALVVALMIGRRHMNGDSKEPHDVPMAVLGAGLLWFGWFGFNAGSALTAGGLAASAFTVTNIAAAAATITWVLASYANTRKVSVVGAACGAVAGLVAITPASGFVTPGGALVIGLVAGGLCYSATLLRARSRVDDALDVFAVHGVGGMFGAIATGIFASTTVQAAYSGLLDGNPQQVVTQAVAVGATILYAAVGTVVIVKVVDLLLGIRVKPEVEEMGSISPSTARPPIRCDGPAPPGPRRRSTRRPPSTPHRRRPARPSPEHAREHPRRSRPRRPAAPLYEARFEHDACGVGFVADAGGRSRDRVLPLALAGLAALGHRGAFGADGESSDGAGVALPARPLAPELLAGDAAAAGRASCRSSCRAAVRPERGHGRSSRRRSPRRACRSSAWRAVPVDAAALGAAAAASRPAFAQAVVARPARGADDPRPISDDAFERRLVVARRRLETAARAAGGALAELSVPSASARTIVYKGLVIGGRLPDLYPDLRAPLPRRLRGLPPALCDEHAPRVAARPALPVDRPQRRDQHGPRQPRAGPRPGRRRRAARSPGSSSRPARSCRPTAPTRCRSTRRSSS